MELVEVYVGIKNARPWNPERVNFLPGAYGNALKHIYGEQYVHVDVEDNAIEYKKKLLKNERITYDTELV